jgi:pheganomycin biosynthesis PGM1-like protein
MNPVHNSTELSSMRISIQSRECIPELLERIPGAALFPERAIGAAIVNTLRRPNDSLICVTAPEMEDIEHQIDYFVRLSATARAEQCDHHVLRDRLTILSIDDGSPRWLSEKLLDSSRPEAVAACRYLESMVDRARRAGRRIELTYFEPSEPLERLAKRLDLVGNQAPAKYISLGTKAAGRDIFQALHIPVAPATALVHGIDALGTALAPLVRQGRRHFMLKLNSTQYGAGMGNALFDLDDDILADSAEHDLASAITERLPTAWVTDSKLGWSGFSSAVPVVGVLAEELITGDQFCSPSFQGRLTSNGPDVVSTHEQMLAPNRQSYTGGAFPAAESYRILITEYGRRIGKALHAQGINRGDYGVDFIAVQRNGQWKVFACELNLRTTGTQHGFDMVTGLLGTTPGSDGELRVNGERRVYLVSDNVADEGYVGLRPRQLIEAVERSPLHYDPSRRQGVVLHMMSALPKYGKFGAVCIADSATAACSMMSELHALVHTLSTAAR